MKRFYCTCIVLAFFNFSIAQESSPHQTAMFNADHYTPAEDLRNAFYAKLMYSVKQSDELNWQNLSLSSNGEQQTVVAPYNRD